MTKTVAIILAGGAGIRFGFETPKQFVKLAGKRIIEHTIDVFESHPLINEIYIVIHKDFYDLMEEIVQRNAYKKVKKILKGGETRQKSSEIGVLACNDADKVLTHDAVRPFVSKRIITEVIYKLDEYPAVDVAVPVTDTIIKISDKKIIEDIPQRKYLWRGQTPQGFLLPVIKKAHLLAKKEGIKDSTDDCSLVLRYNLGKIYVVDGSEYNIKITYPLDIHIADKIFQIRKSRLEDVDVNKLKKDLKGKVIVVFGGTSGIGLEICNLSKRLGAYTYGFSRRTNVDVRDIRSVEAKLNEVYKKHNRIDVVVNSSGILKMTFIESADLSDIIEQINTNLIGSIIVAKASIPYLKETKGNLIFFASSSYTRGRRGYTPYSASKAAIVNFVQGLAEELSHYEIKVNVINPERTDTPLRRKTFGEEDKSLLLSPKFVALMTLKAITTNLTGAVIDIKKMDEEKMSSTGDIPRLFAK